MKVYHLLLIAFGLSSITNSFAQTTYKVSYAELKTYQGIYQYENHKLCK